MTEWKEYLLGQAERNQMCTPFFDALKGCQSKVNAIRLYKKNVTWAAENNYPPLNVLRRDFPGYESEGIFVDRVFDGQLFKKQQVYVLHNCSGRITIDINTEHQSIPMLYIANGCNLIIERAEGEDKLPISVPVYVFGSNNVVAKDTNRIHFRIYRKHVKE